MAMDNPEKYGENFGKPWCIDEERKLLKLINENKPISEISQEHGRTVGAIKARLMHIAKNLHEKGKTNDDIEKSLKFLTSAEIVRAVAPKPKKENKNKINDINKRDDLTDSKKILSLIIEMRDALNFLVEIELRKNKMTKSDFQHDITTVDERHIETKRINNDTFDINKEDEWMVAVIYTIKKYKNFDAKLKEIRTTYNVPEDVFNSKIKKILDAQKNDSNCEARNVH